MFSSLISPCVVSFLSLYTCFFMYKIFISVSHMMLWWVLFKCFRKTGCESLSCRELSSYKVSQEFVVRIDLLCNTTSGYELSDLWLPSYFICLLWFCHRLPKGEIVRTYVDHVKNIWHLKLANPLKKKQFTCNWIDLGCV